MTEKEIKRINELAKKKKEVGLTEDELQEQAILRKAYIAAVRGNLIATLENTSIKEADGSITPVRRKNVD